MTPGTPGRLFVFLHGLTVIAEHNDNFEIALPRVRGHVYKAGSWLAETTIEDGATLRLMNIDTTGTAGIYKSTFLIDVGPDYLLTHRRRAATLIVHRPEQVLFLLRSEKAGRLNIAGTQLQTLAEVVVLVYSFRDENAVFLDGHFWQPVPTGGSISLHVIATSEVQEGKEHELETQRALREVFHEFPGVVYAKAKATPPAPPKPIIASWVDPNHPDFGLPPDFRTEGMHILDQNGNFAFAAPELEHPASRLQRLNRLGRMFREKRRIDGLWRRPDPLGGDNTSPCGSMTGNLTP